VVCKTLVDNHMISKDKHTQYTLYRGQLLSGAHTGCSIYSMN